MGFRHYIFLRYIFCCHSYKKIWTVVVYNHHVVYDYCANFLCLFPPHFAKEENKNMFNSITFYRRPLSDPLKFSACSKFFIFWFIYCFTGTAKQIFFSVFWIRLKIIIIIERISNEMWNETKVKKKNIREMIEGKKS